MATLGPLGKLSVCFGALQLQVYLWEEKKMGVWSWHLKWHIQVADKGLGLVDAGEKVTSQSVSNLPQ